MKKQNSEAKEQAFGIRKRFYIIKRQRNKNQKRIERLIY